MHQKIWCNEESEIFLQFFLETKQDLTHKK
jgi:hypothetical protein